MELRKMVSGRHWNLPMLLSLEAAAEAGWPGCERGESEENLGLIASLQDGDQQGT